MVKCFQDNLTSFKTILFQNLDTVIFLSLQQEGMSSYARVT